MHGTVDANECRLRSCGSDQPRLVAEVPCQHTLMFKIRHDCLNYVNTRRKATCAVPCIIVARSIHTRHDLRFDLCGRTRQVMCLIPSMFQALYLIAFLVGCKLCIIRACMPADARSPSFHRVWISGRVLQGQWDELMKCNHDAVPACLDCACVSRNLETILPSFYRPCRTRRGPALRS